MSDFQRAAETMTGIFQLAQERDRLRELLREAEKMLGDGIFEKAREHDRTVPGHEQWPHHTPCFFAQGHYCSEAISNVLDGHTEPLRARIREALGEGE